MKSKLVLCLTFVLFSTSLFATPLLDVAIPDAVTKHSLMLGGYDVISIDKDYAQVVGWPDDIERLQTEGFNYIVSMPDMETFFQGRINYELDDMGGYATFDEVGEWAHDFVEAHPDIVSEIDTLGYSIEERPIWAFKMSDNPGEDEDEPELFINSLIHAREPITVMVLMNFCEYLADNYGVDDRVTEIVDNRELWFLPVINPDGYTYNQQRNPNGGGMWRKNKRRVNGTIRGVDLNRNFTYMWAYDDIGSSDNPRDETYRGDAPGSEPEIQTYMQFINDHNIISVINYHSYSNVIIHPFGYDANAYSDYDDIYRPYTSYLAEPLGWAYGRAIDVINYTANGECTDWLDGGADYHVFGFVFEVGSRDDNFWPAENRIEPLVEEQIEPLLRFCEVGANPYVLLPPPTPVVSVPDTVSGVYEVSWTTEENDQGNEPVAFDLMEMASTVDIDDAETINETWDIDGFVRTDDDAFDGSYSYYAHGGAWTYETMTARWPYTVQDGDQVMVMMSYDIEEEWDFAYVQASFDGEEFINLPGNLTTNDDPHDRNLGNGITGNSDGWVTALFDLDDYAGQSMILRIAYVCDARVLGDGFYVDSITPVTSFQDYEIIATDFEGDSYQVDATGNEEESHIWYAVQAIDDRGDRSAWSSNVGTVVLPVMEGNTLTVPVAANRFELISMNLTPLDLDAETVFSSLDHLSIVYNDAGGIFLPPAINTMGEVDPVEGYQVFNSEADTWVVSGDPLDPATEYSLMAGPWNWLGYPFDYATDPVNSLAGIADQIVILINDDGEMWLPDFVNTIDALVPGEGYMVIVSDNVTFTYSEPNLRAVPLPDRTPKNPMATGKPYAVLVQIDGSLVNNRLDSIELYDGQTLVGRKEIGNSDFSSVIPVVAWQGDTEHGLSGFTPGHSIEVVLRDQSGNTLSTVQSQPSGEVGYGEGAYASVAVRASAQPVAFSVNAAYPNPFNPELSVPIVVPESGEVEISLFNTLGQTVYHSHRVFESGSHLVSLNLQGGNVRAESGMYFLRVNYRNQAEIQKVLLLK